MSDSGRTDVEPGELGDSWFLAAVSSLTLTPRFLERVVPKDQNFDTTISYCGLFRYVLLYMLIGYRILYHYCRLL